MGREPHAPGAATPRHLPKLKALADPLFRLLEFLIVACLAAMVVMVFGNVVLRYAFDSGIPVSEEMARFCFVWLTFIGSVVVAREHAHMGVESFVRLFGARGRRVCMILSDLLVLLCCAVFFWGTWRQAPLNASNTAPITGIPMSWIYGVGFFTSAGIGVITALRLARALQEHDVVKRLRNGVTRSHQAVIAQDQHVV